VKSDETTLAVDCHLHLYQFADLPRLLSAAVAHSEKARGPLQNPAPAFGGKAILPTLILTEPKGRDSFARMLELTTGPERQALPGWRLRPGGDGLSLFADRDDGAAVLIVSGQQVVTAERLEILAVACRQDYEDGRPLTETLNAIRRSAFPVLPWGVGKWLGRRGRLFDALVSQASPEDFALADTVSRPFFWREPRFAAARARGQIVLRGSDPLPLPGQVEKAGAFGSLMRIPFDADQPAFSLLAALRGGSVDTVPFGQPDSCRAFLGAQLALRRSRAAG